MSLIALILTWYIIGIVVATILITVAHIIRYKRGQDVIIKGEELKFNILICFASWITVLVAIWAIINSLIIPKIIKFYKNFNNKEILTFKHKEE